jgi:hypothetical protein
MLKIIWTLLLIGILVELALINYKASLMFGVLNQIEENIDQAQGTYSEKDYYEANWLNKGNI